MDTDALISTLARDPEVKGRPASLALALCLAGILTYSVLAILLIAGARPDFAVSGSWVAAKAGLSLLFALAALPVLVRVAKPGVGGGVGCGGVGR